MAATVATAYNAAAHGYQSNMTTESKHSASSSKSSSRSASRSEQQDRFYGYREPSELCERFILYLFACPLDSTSASASLPATSNGNPAPRLSEFIAYALYRTRLPEAVTFQALYLLLRLKIRFPAARGSSGHRLFISALMIASKSSCDDTYSNKSWAIVGQGLFSLREINQMERELFGYLGYKVNVSPDDLEMFTYELEQDVDGGRIDLVVRKILELMSRRTSVDMDSHDAPRERCESVSSVKSSAPPTPALESSGFSSPSTDSHAGPHRFPSGRHSRQSSVSHSFSTRASISSASTGHIPASTSMPASAPMVKSTSHRQERSATAPSFIHPFINSARERCRPYSTPAHSLPLSSSTSSSSAAAGYYSNSPAASISSSSVCSSYAHSSAMSATPSPYASRSIMSGRTTPDTPPSDLDMAHFEESRYYAVDPKIDLSPTSTVAYKLPQHQQQAGFNGAASDSYLHPYSWRS
ncbi:PHO85 cyclin-9 [Pseudozyma hubeiensis]|nr:PHO85 cyclin-9 [Pseudozyma hubeiensis]